MSAVNPVFAGCPQNTCINVCGSVFAHAWSETTWDYRTRFLSHVRVDCSMEEEMEYELSPERLSPRVSPFSLTPRSDSGPSKVCGRDFGESARTAPS